MEYLEELGMGRTAFEVYLGEKPAREAIGFEHEFDPAAHVPAPIFFAAFLVTPSSAPP